MLTFRLFQSYRVFQLLLILIVSSEVILGQTNKKCAEFNEYCQNHWDCCSNSCMSYNYRCTRGYNVHKDPYIGALNKPTMTLDDILNINFGNKKTSNYNENRTTETKPYFVNRFDEDDTTPTEVKIILQNSRETTERSAIKTQMHLFENRIGEIEPSQQPEYKVTEKVDGISPKPESQMVSNKDGVTILLDDKKQDEPCKEIGLKCYTNDECCSQRCHGFLHKCVT